MTATLRIDGVPCPALTDILLEGSADKERDRQLLGAMQSASAVMMRFRGSIELALAAVTATSLAHFYRALTGNPPPRCRCRTCPTCQRLLARARARRARRHPRIRRER